MATPGPGRPETPNIQTWPTSPGWTARGVHGAGMATRGVSPEMSPAWLVKNRVEFWWKILVLSAPLKTCSALFQPTFQRLCPGPFPPHFSVPFSAPFSLSFSALLSVPFSFRFPTSFLGLQRWRTRAALGPGMASRGRPWLRDGQSFGCFFVLGHGARSGTEALGGYTKASAAYAVACFQLSSR